MARGRTSELSEMENMLQSEKGSRLEMLVAQRGLESSRMKFTGRSSK